MSRSNGSRLAAKRRAENFGQTSVSASLAQCLGLEDHHGSASAARKLRETPRQLNRQLHNRVHFGLVELVANRPEYAVKFARKFLELMLEREAKEAA